MEAWKPFIPWLKPEAFWLVFVKGGLAGLVSN
jgi:hypothetical protein